MFLAIEIGGTKLQLGIGTGESPDAQPAGTEGQGGPAGVAVPALADVVRRDVEPSAGAQRIVEQIRDAVPLALREAGVDRSEVRGVGIGYGGPVDAATGVVIKSHHVAGWENFPLGRWCQEEL